MSLNEYKNEVREFLIRMDSLNGDNYQKITWLNEEFESKLIRVFITCKIVQIIKANGGINLYIKSLSENEKEALKQRFKRIKELQEQGICFGCYNFKTGDIFPDEGLIFYEDDKVRCQFEKFPRATGQTVIVTKEHYEDISEMPLELGTYILKISNAIIKLHKEILGAEKVYMCTLCDGKRNHLHFSLFPRLKGDTIGFKNFVKEDGILMDYHETVETYKQKMKELI